MSSPHQNTPIIQAGQALSDADAALILVHGRGATAQSILTLADEFTGLDSFALFAPQANMNTWYPNSFLAPMTSNQPGLDSALEKLEGLVEEIEAAGIATNRILIGGFSQGACLALEFTARNAKRYGGVFALSGGVIGPQGTPRDYAGSMEGTPVFLGCSDIDFHIPVERVHESADVFDALRASVNKQIYPGMGHTVNRDEIAHVQTIIDSL
ncbi:MAG: dienelactone hydrolase family protein [Chloroflexota bacterium]